jgi:predicted regulator of Ras-like GTPase activity (Roadblock/LC7/MglB family)
VNAESKLVNRVETTIYQTHIEALMTLQPEISGVLISTVDGFEIASRLAQGKSAAKLSAMTSSLLALAEAMCTETAGGACRDLVIDAEAGRVLLMELPHRTQNLVLAVLCSNKITLGQVLWAVRNCREHLSRRLNML